MTFVQENYQSGDSFVMQEAIALLPFRRYYSDEKAYDMERFDYAELEDVPTHDRIWVIYNNPRVNIHRQTVIQKFNPYQDNPPISEWLTEWRDRIITRNLMG